ncbi:LLM class flavin-dependent oxidoreductase [Baekduia sp. Peel2402]|uniref:LLM class flavin-dependent oxidoreductase n=1 Tax=Baekduia sp. Peel2402 TaxID=3458296 RepID=UPI00403E8D25
MTITLHWFLPTTGDSRGILGAGAKVGAHHRRADPAAGERPPDVDYLAQIARSAEQLGFEGALTPTGTWCEDAWIATAALTQVTQRLKFLVAFRPGLLSPTLAAQMAATFQRVSRGRLLLNVVVGGDEVEQARFGDFIDKDERYARADEFLAAVRGAWHDAPYDQEGKYITVKGAEVVEPPPFPGIYLGGSSPPALRVAARHADVYLTWGEPPEAVAEKVARVRDIAAQEGRQLKYGIRLHVIARETADEAWAVANRLIADLDPEAIAHAQHVQRHSQSEGQRRMTALHDGDTNNLEIAPNLWAGVGLVRGGAGTALVGSYAEVADRITELHDLGIEEYIFSGYPHLEEAYHLGEGVRPLLAALGLLAGAGAADAAPPQGQPEGEARFGVVERGVAETLAQPS